MPATTSDYSVLGLNHVNYINHCRVSGLFRLIQTIGFPIDCILFIIAFLGLLSSAGKIAFAPGALMLAIYGENTSETSYSMEADLIRLMSSAPWTSVTVLFGSACLVVSISYFRSWHIVPLRSWFSVAIIAISAYLLFCIVLPIIIAITRPFGYLNASLVETLLHLGWPIMWIASAVPDPDQLSSGWLKIFSVVSVSFLIFGLLSAFLITLLGILAIGFKRDLGRISPMPRSFSMFWSSLSLAVCQFSRSVAMRRWLILLLSGPFIASINPLLWSPLANLFSIAVHPIVMKLDSMIGLNDAQIGASAKFVSAGSVSFFACYIQNCISSYCGAAVGQIRWVGFVILAIGVCGLTMLGAESSADYSRTLSLMGPIVLFLMLPPILWVRHSLALSTRNLRHLAVERIKFQSTLQDSWLFLRSFGLDPISVHWPLELLRYLPALGIRRYRLEHVIAECAIRFGPLRAVGNPSDKEGDHGVIKEFLSDSAWRPFVSDALVGTQGVVFLFGAGRYIGWELERIVALGVVERTIFVAPPKPSDAQAFLDQAASLLQAAMIPETVVSDVRNGSAICFYRSGDNWNVVLNNLRSAFDYRMALHKALSDVSKRSRV